MIVYTASAFENYKQVRWFNDSVRRMGHVVAHDWTRTSEFDEDCNLLIDGPPTDEQRYLYGMMDYAGAMACDLLCFIDTDIKPLNGARWEAGIAIGHGAKVWVINYFGSHRVIFDVLPQVRDVGNEQQALTLLGSFPALP